MQFSILFSLILPAIVLASDFSDSNRLFDLAKIVILRCFLPPGNPTCQVGRYLARYYPNTDTYIGTKAGKVYVYGDVFDGLRNVGQISDYIELDSDGDELLAQLFADGISDVQVLGNGTVIVILPDDLQGSRHQRFIIQLKSGTNFACRSQY